MTFATFRKKFPSTVAGRLMLVGTLLVLAGSAMGVVAIAQQDATQTNTDKTTGLRVKQTVASDAPETVEPVTTDGTAAATEPAATSPAATKQPTTQTPPTAPPKKTTPPTKPPTTPAPQPAYFTKKVTGPGQFNPGDMVYSIKGGNGYYAGTLVISPATITWAPDTSKNVTVATPDGKVVSVPASPYDDRSPYFGPSMSYSASNAASFPMFVSSNGTAATPGTYRVHIQAGYAANNGNDIWTYHGWLTVIVP